MRIFQSGNRHEEVQATIFSTDGKTRKLSSLSLSGHGKYESLRTYNKYPGGWSISDGKGKVMLEVIPVVDDQEVYTFSLQRGVMQYHCTVEGKVDGLEVDGTANVEATGSRFDFNEFFWGQKKTNLASQLEAFIPEQVSERWLRRLCRSRQHINLDLDALQKSIIAPLWSMMNRGGKGWRSTWYTLCCHAFGNSIENEQIRGLLPVTELIHTGSLIIDDIQDHSLLRRGKPALHTEIGTDLAINVGNFCYFLPLCVVDEIKGLDDGQRYRILSIVLETLRLGHLGQAVDLMWSNSRMDVAAKLEEIEQTTNQLIEQYRSKSGCQLNAIARIAGELNRAPAELVRALADYSDSFGVVFQIIDDVIDVVDGKAVLGKENNEDLRNFKLNFVMLKAFGSLDASSRVKWFERIQSSEQGTRTKLLLKLIYSTDAVHAALSDAYDIYNQSLKKLDSLPATDAKLMMKLVPAWLLDQQRIKLKSWEVKLQRKN
ncbi:MAG: polyprenyl synthetase family protein [Arenicella sp.]|nr:polyprenyl synthetase family protein [Arenicella sp.]